MLTNSEPCPYDMLTNRNYVLPPEPGQIPVGPGLLPLGIVTVPGQLLDLVVLVPGLIHVVLH